MRTNPQHKATRLPTYAYSQAGAYFVTVVGDITAQVWREFPNHYDQAIRDKTDLKEIWDYTYIHQPAPLATR